MQRNTAREDQQDPKLTFMSCHVHARATHRLGFSNKCITRLEKQQGLIRDIAGIHWRMQSSLHPQSRDFISDYVVAFLIVIVFFAWGILTQKEIALARHVNLFSALTS
jgi:hypothetical protein